MKKITDWFKKTFDKENIVKWWKGLKFWQKAMIVLGSILAVVSLVALAASS